MDCLSDKKLILYLSDALLNQDEKRRIEAHILECDQCFQKYFEILQILSRDEGFQEDLDHHPYHIDFMINSQEETLHPISIFSQNVSLNVLEYVTRSNHTHAVFQICKQQSPSLLLQRVDEGEYWSLSFEASFPAISLVSNDKIYYKAPYQQRTRILLERGLSYHLFFGEKPAFLFKLC